MADAHARLHQWRQALKRGEDDGRRPDRAKSAAELAREASSFVFDEVSARDIANAMILGRLFTALFAAGVVVVAYVSNVAPDDLYKDGLNRALFLPFIALMQRAARRGRAWRADRLPAREAEARPGLLCADRPEGGRRARRRIPAR